MLSKLTPFVKKINLLQTSQQKKTYEKPIQLTSQKTILRLIEYDKTTPNKNEYHRLVTRNSLPSAHTTEYGE